MATVSANEDKFMFPPFHSFPPSYTRQPVPETLAKQTQLWCDLIRDYCRIKRIFWLDITMIKNESLFRNDKIGRRLSDEDILFFLGQLVSRGDGEWATDHMHCLVYWRRPREWGDLIFGWVQRKALGGQVLTVGEIRTGKWTHGEGMPVTLFATLLPVLLAPSTSYGDARTAEKRTSLRFDRVSIQAGGDITQPCPRTSIPVSQPENSNGCSKQQRVSSPTDQISSIL
jgi:ESCRT-II complex subunit VPS25